ncbi:MAG TPA: hypothetical protein VMU99_03180 [Acidimicrobiales bacterium]|nr:hypothetical protein [Acidimicrobiales bacterium]
MARLQRAKPNQLVSGDWLDGAANGASAAAAQVVARRLRTAIGDKSFRSIQQLTGVPHSTVRRILVGDAWADLETIVKLEVGLDIDLLGGWRSEAK